MIFSSSSSSSLPLIFSSSSSSSFSFYTSSSSLPLIFSSSLLFLQMLLFLKDFSNRITSRTHEIEKQVDTLVHEVKSTDTRLNNVYNDFLMLANIQFVENVSQSSDLCCCSINGILVFLREYMKRRTKTKRRRSRRMRRRRSRRR